MSDPLIIDKSFLHDGVLIIAAITMLVAALSDIKKLIISNRLCLFLAGLFPLYVLTAPHEVMWMHHVLIAGTVFVIGFAMFAMNFLGGGDVKMLAAVSLWAGPKMIATLLLFTSFAGGLLALAFAVAALYRSRVLKVEAKTETNEVIPWHKTPVPYGVAIACGGVTALFLMSQAV
ncbi:MAG: prepilin peptidase [Alphaproteobacteria bacterium]|nr:prepilin peptidase [Alphaproteobacteria bacterium]